ncbi:hypothetical protein AYI70_g2280 [Smittium culicis]|uniref:LITAF domain-containing protein n=1 Tax=Smittium culicis TaxID=133412 RepID=A0A1R1Y913_9FUNG|nr:hypothetical protein AYI70_g2280 [Smittium culicis]
MNSKEREAFGNGYGSSQQNQNPNGSGSSYLNNSIVQDNTQQASGSNPGNQQSNLPSYNDLYSTAPRNQSASVYPAPIRPQAPPQQFVQQAPPQQFQQQVPSQQYQQQPYQENQYQGYPNNSNQVNPNMYQNSSQQLQPVNQGNSTLISSKGQPMNIICPNCNKNVVTSIKRKAGGKTVAAVLGVGLVFWPLMWVPLTMKSLKKKVHVCPYCGIDLGNEILVQVQKIDAGKQ